MKEKDRNGGKKQVMHKNLCEKTLKQEIRDLQKWRQM